MPNFVYLQEFVDATGSYLSADVVAPDSVVTDVLTNTFPTIEGQNSWPDYLLSDIVITKDSEVSITFLKSICTLNNTLLVYTYTNDYQPRKLGDITGDVFVVFPKAKSDAIQQGTRFKIPRTYKKENYLNFEKVASVSSYTHVVGTMIGFILLSPFFDYVKDRQLHNYTNSKVKKIYSDYTKNIGLPAQKMQVKYVQKTSTRHFLGFEDIPIRDPECDRDFNDCVIELTTSTPDSLLVDNKTSPTTTASIAVNQGPNSIKTIGNVSGNYTASTNTYIDNGNQVQTGGSRMCFTNGSNHILYSQNRTKWVIHNDSGDTNISNTTTSLLPPLTFTNDDLVVLYKPVISTVYGNVINGTTGSILEGTRTTLDNPVRPIQTETDTDGYYEFTIDPLEINISTSQIIYNTHGFIDLYSNTFINGSSAPLIPISVQPSIRIVLTWGEQPTDLDSHLLTSAYHIWYNNLTDSDGSEEASLDLDDITSYGPETVTVFNPTNRLYRFYVHNYSVEIPLSAISKAEVRLYINNVLIDNVNIAGATNWNNSSARYWHVFDIQNLTYKKVHAFRSTAPSTTAK